MSIFIFIYNGSEIEIPCEKNERLSEIIQRFCLKVGVTKENMNFLYNGINLNEQTTENNILMNQNDQKYIIVVQNDSNNTSQDVMIKSKVIICPQCQEPAIISIDNYHLTISGCKNGHKIEDIKIKDFYDTQKINITKIICNQCKNKNMGNTQDNLFFKCVECKKNLCILCKSTHNSNHNIYNYFNKYYTCEYHGEAFVSYCFDCKYNLCFICEKNHNNHQIQLFENLYKEDQNKLNKELTEFKENINILKEKINNFKIKCNKVVESYETLYTIKRDIYNNINIKQRNFQNWYNQKFIINCINDDIRSIIKDINLNNNYATLLKIYEQIELVNIKEKYKNYIIIKYKIIENQNRIKIFDRDFVDNNKKHCKIIYDNKEHELSDYIEIKNLRKIEKNILEIKLIGIEDIRNAYCMFYDCSSLISLPDISEWNTKNVTHMNCMFAGCSSLISLPDISKWNLQNLITMNSIFARCSSLQSLPDISKWDISNARDIGNLIGECSSLKYIPDISIWNTSKITAISSFFQGCSSLISLPDISKWDINNIKSLDRMFCGCSLLISLPDISKWNANNITFLGMMFYGCSSLISLPDISKWNISKLDSKEDMFADCFSCLIIPNKFI